MATKKKEKRMLNGAAISSLCNAPYTILQTGFKYNIWQNRHIGELMPIYYSNTRLRTTIQPNFQTKTLWKTKKRKRKAKRTGNEYCLSRVHCWHHTLSWITSRPYCLHKCAVSVSVCVCARRSQFSRAEHVFHIFAAISFWVIHCCSFILSAPGYVIIINCVSARKNIKDVCSCLLRRNKFFAANQTRTHTHVAPMKKDEDFCFRCCWFGRVNVLHT